MFKKCLIRWIFLMAVIFFGGCSEKKVVLEIQEEKVDKKQESQIVFEEEIKSSFRDKTIQELLNQNKNLECRWRVEKAEISADADVENIDEEASGGIEEGQIYFKEGQFFQEVQITENSRKTVIKTLKKGDWFYQWNSLVVDQGMKMPFERAEEAEVLKINKVYNWDCQEFFGSEDVFQVPEDIIFLDF